MGIDPITMAIIGTAVSTASAGVAALGAMQESSYQAAVAARNAKLDEENAVKAMQASQETGQDYGIAAGQELAAMMAERAASGTTLGEGSNALNINAARRMAKRDQERIRTEGINETESFLQRAAGSRASAAQAKRSRTFAALGGAMSMGSNYVAGSQSISKARMIE